MQPSKCVVFSALGKTEKAPVHSNGYVVTIAGVWEVVLTVGMMIGMKTGNSQGRFACRNRPGDATGSVSWDGLVHDEQHQASLPLVSLSTLPGSSPSVLIRHPHGHHLRQGRLRLAHLR